MIFSVESTLDKHLLATEEPRPPDGYWHPSAIFSCERQAVYEKRGVPQSNERDARSRRILKLGSTLHEIVQKALADDANARAVYNEVRVEIPGLKTRGSLDSLLEFSDDEYELLELKSISASGFKYGGMPKPEHVKQARTYAMALMRYGGVAGTLDAADRLMTFATIPPLGNKLKRVRMVYFSRDDLTMREFTQYEGQPILPTQEWMDDLEGKIALLDAYMEDGTALPPRLPLDEKGKLNWLCRDYCLWRTRCFGIDPEGVEL